MMLIDEKKSVGLHLQRVVCPLMESQRLDCCSVVVQRTDLASYIQG